jgi:uncharacterized protein (TIGR02118 family)
MIRVSVMYPHKDGARFDHKYYAEKHMAIVRNGMGNLVKKIEVDHGVAGGAPGAPAPFVSMGHLYFDSIEDYQSAMAKGGAAAMADLPNFTDIQPQIQVAELKEV